MRSVSLKTIAAAAMIAAIPASGWAQQGAAPPVAGRYTMSPTDGGFIRLDTLTGEMSLCRKSGDDWSCAAMDDAGRASGPRGDSQELADLRQENDRLREEVRRLEDMLGLAPRDRAGPPPHGSDAPPPRERPFAEGFRLPSERQVEEALDYFANILKKFQDRLQQLEKQPPQSSEPKKEERAL